jgi:hypothetical protein
MRYNVRYCKFLICKTFRVCGRSLAGIVGLNPAGESMSVCCKCCVLPGRVLCVELVTRPEESYRLWCVWVWSRVFDNEEALTPWGCFAMVRKGISWGFLQLSNKPWLNIGYLFLPTICSCVYINCGCVNMCQCLQDRNDRHRVLALPTSSQPSYRGETTTECKKVKGV